MYKYVILNHLFFLFKSSLYDSLTERKKLSINPKNKKKEKGLKT